MEQNSIDVILTSYARYDLLERTLDSFFGHNDHPVQHFYIYEDYGWDNMDDATRAQLWRLKARYPHIKWIVPNERHGQIVALDELLSRVTTPYYFSLEDDWVFYKPGFIAASMPIMQQHQQCIQVWLRELDDTCGHPYYLENGLLKMKLNHGGIWNGFSFNPGLKRLGDYKAIGNYSRHTFFDYNKPWTSEAAIGRIYAKRGYYAAILPEGYIRHIGEERGIRA